MVKIRFGGDFHYPNAETEAAAAAGSSEEGHNLLLVAGGVGANPIASLPPCSNTLHKGRVRMSEIASIFEAHFSRCSITIYNFYPRVFFCFFLSAAKPTDQGEGGVVLLVGFVVVVGGFGGTVFRSPMYTQNMCIQRKLFLKMGVSRENFSSKGVHQDKTFLQNGCIKTKLWLFFRCESV